MSECQNDSEIHALCKKTEQRIQSFLMALDNDLRRLGVTIDAVNVDMRDNGFTYLSVDIPFVGLVVDRAGR